MTLFEMPDRKGRSSVAKVVTKSKTTTKSTVAIKKGNNLITTINEIKAAVQSKLGQYKNDYINITDLDTLHEYITQCLMNSYISIDTETDGLDPLQNKLAGICIYTHNQKGAYIPINHISYITQQLLPGQLGLDKVLPEFERLLSGNPWIDMFNAKFDIRVLRHAGLKNIYCTWDGSLAAHILNDNEPTYKLKKLHQKYVLGGKGDAFSFDELFDKIPFTYIPYNIGYLYSAHDPVITKELCEYQRKYLKPESARKDMRDMYWVFKNIEMPCVSVVADMEDTGIELDMKYQQELSVKYNRLMEEKTQDFYKACDLYREQIDSYKKKNLNHKLDDPINMGSPTQLAILFYDILKLKSPDKKAPRGTGVDILKSLDNPIAKAVLDYRAMAKLVSTYIDKLPECVNPDDGRVHCSFHQYGARTGRFASSDPNLQNIPSRNHDIRKMFKATDGYVLMSSDYSQQEPKVMTQMCQDPKMIKAYQEGKDLYAEIAALSFNTTYDNCLEFRPDGTTNTEGKNRRSQAKSILLGVLYGRGVPSIAEQLGTTTKKAQAIKDSVFKGFPAIPQFEEDSIQMAQDLGYVTTLWGRKRRLPDMQLDEFEFEWKNGAAPTDDLIDFDDEDENFEVPYNIQKKYLKKLYHTWGSEKQAVIREAAEEGIKIIDNGGKIADATRQCVNARIQGSAADMSKLAMIKVGNDRRLKELGFRLLIPVHDELIAECPEEHAKECSERFAQLMSEAAGSRLTIPIKCDVEITKCWYGERVEV